MKQKLNRLDYQFKKKQNETLVKVPGEINGQDFVIMYCEDSNIYLCDHMAQVFVDVCKNCTVHLGPVCGSVFVRQCENVTISSASHQFRVSNSNNIKCFIYTQSDPALEKSTNVQFAPYNFNYPSVAEHFQKANINLDEDKWSQVFDFTPNLDKRNWSILNPSDYSQDNYQIEGYEVENHPVPIPIAYGGTDSKKIIVGSADAANQEQGGQGLDYFMGKEYVQQIQNQEEQDYLKSTKPQDTEAFEVYDDNVSQIAQANVQSMKNFNAFDDQILEPQNAIHSLRDFPQTPQQAGIINEFLKQARERDAQEQITKLARKQKAKLFIENFMREQQEIVNTRKQQNRLVQQSVKIDKSDPWKLIRDNINLKDASIKKEISQMQQAILAKVGAK